MAEQRMVRRDILTSDPVNSLSWAAEVFYRRLMSVVDDFGRYEARPEILRAEMYCLKLDIVSKPDIVKWMNECSDAGLIRLYSVGGKEYLEILKFGQRLRNKKSKYPEPENSRQMAADGGDPPRVAARREIEVEEKRTEAHAHDLSQSNLFRKPVPPSKKEVWEHFSRSGGTKEMAKSFYEKYESTGWFLHGSPISNWASLANRFITNWKGNEPAGSSAPPLKAG